MAMYAIDKEGQPLPLWRILLLPGGRVSRAPFNLTILGNLVAVMVLGSVGFYLKDSGVPEQAYAFPIGLIVIFGQYIQLAVGAKRLHDMGKSGWWQLLYMLPLLNLILMLMQMVRPGKREDNEYGPYPSADKVATAAATTRVETREEAPADDAADEPITYPLPFLKVLFSFRGRLNRKAFWLKGVLPILIIGFILQGLIGGIATFIYGAAMVSDIAGAIGPGKDAVFLPMSQFQAREGRTVGVVTADAQGTRFEVEVAAQRDTGRIAREVVVSGRRLMVTADKKPDKAIGYDVKFAWRNLPPAPAAAAATPEPMGARVLSGLATILGLLMLWPWFAIAVKRFHDRGWSGWWSIIGLLPLIGQIAMIVVGSLKGSDGENRFGADPLAAGA